MEAYCFKCRGWKVAVNVVAVTLSNGAARQQGTCPDCKGKLFQLVKGKA